ncbi:MAG: hypothetical protein U0793_08950 [Gemmataceae bacterium]
MHCHICGGEAVGRCYTCGELFCVRHGSEDCLRCETAIAPGDRRGDRVSVKPMPAKQRYGWWRPIPAEDFEPPACHVCHGLARQTCRNCHELYCAEHAGYPGLCQDCSRSARLGMWVLLFSIAALVLMVWLTGMF